MRYLVRHFLFEYINEYIVHTNTFWLTRIQTALHSICACLCKWKRQVKVKETTNFELKFHLSFATFVSLADRAREKLEGTRTSRNGRSRRLGRRSWRTSTRNFEAHAHFSGVFFYGRQIVTYITEVYTGCRSKAIKWYIMRYTNINKVWEI